MFEAGGVLYGAKRLLFGMVEQAEEHLEPTLNQEGHGLQEKVGYCLNGIFS